MQMTSRQFVVDDLLMTLTTSTLRQRGEQDRVREGACRLSREAGRILPKQGELFKLEAL